ncbi:OmpA family protein [Aeromonas jandaei]|uniref:OmpA family protein n=1 Tax=Aeromonas TaxID=642 RepID=UPI00059D6E91|nr:MULTISPECIES: OmpA family protein [Aeromonas]KIQ85010.1 membrane protein [Aeromonas sp. L_1B5_3]MBL0544721.1 OmpA family protein [Aeromonas jandaei]MBW3804662.1 OmpA family protein [Aeromonas jandaei]
MMKMAPSLIAITMAALGATAAHAADDIYFGAGVGAAHFNGLNKIESTNVGEEDAAAANAFVGYNFTENFGTEFGYQYAGRGNTDGNRYENQGATLSGIARLPLGGDFSAFAEGGAYWAHTDGLGVSDTKVSPLAGLGVTYKVNDALDLQARYRYMWDVADLHADNGDRYKSNQSVATLEAVYHPFRSSYVAPAPAPVVEEAPAPVAPQIVEKNFALNSDVLFAFGKDSLKPEGVAALNALYQQIVEFQPKDGNAVVVGYTDRIGSDAYNQKLSEARARTVANFLVSKGMAASKVAIEGRGEANPVTGTKCNGVKAKAQLISCLAPDRRVEVRVSGVQEVQK